MTGARATVWTVLVPLLCLGAGASTEDPAAGVEARVAALTAGLELTDEQRPVVERALEQMIRRQRHAVSQLAAAADPTAPPGLGALADELRAAEREAREAMDDVLTEAQLSAVARAVADERARAAGEAIAGRLRQPLELTDEQYDRLVPVFTEHVERRAAQRNAPGRSFGAVRNAREAARRMQVELESDLEPILTPEQMERYRELVEQARERLRGRERGTRGR
ncbi:MAG TPA: hypothetical protein VD788_12075 [Candidatus Polarisedimenticolaceae bacterium]|nr:hypothetical protein [Candidatus Polarisedimenticolaceae bacterium]